MINLSFSDKRKMTTSSAEGGRRPDYPDQFAPQGLSAASADPRTRSHYMAARLRYLKVKKNSSSSSSSSVNDYYRYDNNA